MPDGIRPQWTALMDFLASPTERVFDFVRNQTERSAMEAAIRSLEVDLQMQTIEKGRPYTLRITKTQAAYERRLAAWHADAALLDNMVNKR